MHNTARRRLTGGSTYFSYAFFAFLIFLRTLVYLVTVFETCTAFLAVAHAALTWWVHAQMRACVCAGARALAPCKGAEPARE